MCRCLYFFGASEYRYVRWAKFCWYFVVSVRRILRLLTMSNVLLLTNANGALTDAPDTMRGCCFAVVWLRIRCANVKPKRRENAYHSAVRFAVGLGNSTQMAHWRIREIPRRCCCFAAVWLEVTAQMSQCIRTKHSAGCFVIRWFGPIANSALTVSVDCDVAVLLSCDS